jgi:hypothetical protein
MVTALDQVFIGYPDKPDGDGLRRGAAAPP